jgi:anion-transporting  ArsA/GET3 family ATPase
MVSGRYDLVVLDTPPVKNALDFLESPGRMSRFLDRRILQWFLAPYEDGRVFGRFLRGTSAVVFRLLGYIFGREFLDELAEFLYLFRSLYDGFRERHEAVMGMFSDVRTQFLVVMAPTGPSAAVADYFIEALDERDMPRCGVVANQIHTSSGQALNALEILGDRAKIESHDLAPHTASQLLARLGAAHRRLLGMAEVERTFVDAVRNRMGSGEQMWTVPRFEGEAHDLSALDKVGVHMANP